MKTIDCRGLNCPEPVLKTKNALAEDPAESFEVVVDNETARENVLRLARSEKRETSWRAEGELFHITIAGAPEDTAIYREEKGHSVKGPVLFISTNQLGQGSEELGRLLMRNFIYTLTESDLMPEKIVLMNSGVELSVKDSPVSEDLESLVKKGVQILVCGTCLDFFRLKERHKTGTVSNMYDIAESLLSAGRVITV